MSDKDTKTLDQWDFLQGRTPPKKETDYVDWIIDEDKKEKAENNKKKDKKGWF